MIRTQMIVPMKKAALRGGTFRQPRVEIQGILGRADREAPEGL